MFTLKFIGSNDNQMSLSCPRYEVIDRRELGIIVVTAYKDLSGSGVEYHLHPIGSGPVDGPAYYQTVFVTNEAGKTIDRFSLMQNVVDPEQVQGQTRVA